MPGVWIVYRMLPLERSQRRRIDSSSVSLSSRLLELLRRAAAPTMSRLGFFGTPVSCATGRFTDCGQGGWWFYSCCKRCYFRASSPSTDCTVELDTLFFVSAYTERKMLLCVSVYCPRSLLLVKLFIIWRCYFRASFPIFILTRGYEDPFICSSMTGGYATLGVTLFSSLLPCSVPGSSIGSGDDCHGLHKTFM